MTQFLRKIYLSLYLKGFERGRKRFTVWVMSWRLNRTAIYWPPLLWPYQRFFPVLLGCSTGGLGAKPLCDMFLIPASSLQLQLLNRGSWVPPLLCASSLQLTDFLSSSGLYNCSSSAFFLWASQIALIQPVHGQGYILIFLDRMHLSFTLVHFLFWQLGRG